MEHQNLLTMQMDQIKVQMGIEFPAHEALIAFAARNSLEKFNKVLPQFLPLPIGMASASFQAQKLEGYSQAFVSQATIATGVFLKRFPREPQKVANAMTRATTIFVNAVKEIHREEGPAMVAGLIASLRPHGRSHPNVVKMRPK